MNQFSHFINQLPNEIRSTVETHIGNNIVLFKPNTYITDVEVQLIDYHFALLSSVPPPTMFNGKKIEFRKCNLLAVNPGTKVLCLENPPTAEYYALNIKSHFISKIAQEMGFDGEVRFSKNENPYLNYLKQSIYNFERQIRHFSGNCNLMYDSFAIQITALLLSEVESNFRKPPAPSNNEKHFVETSIDYLNAFYDSNITIDDICKHIYITPFHFIRIFKEKTGMTPHEYLLNIRIKKAKDLLQSRECTVSEVSKICGFVSISHFSYVFKRRTGKSPTEYKKVYFI